MNISADQLADVIMKTLDDYAEATEESVTHGVITVADRCVSDLQSAAPSGSGRYGSWDAYNSSWARTKLSANKKGLFSVAVHNKKHYQLAHLLENGHALRGGGRTRAFPHIAPVAERAEDQLLNEIKKSI